ncbi:benzoate/H(+) symporter BenE family transporter [Pelotomaculum propionicicum]|uniref:Inner membrane protein YdcO n=1 Tax=Pelotomaculum propionicicum TaxID=258475 RepID=A0A4Y7RK36_9FIRM|nr:benzoate/H(+) symporter BenE family transporter [Pelotomaculum propionicicum]NLI12190.1 hypothetical protein [Peptococcaceae bacterium]TEB09042.1 Inner membrane protein YdcO [Pelotomaculum propionicicum]
MVDAVKRAIFERGPGIRSGLRDLHFNKDNISSFFVSFVFSLTGAVVVLVSVATKANFTQEQAVSWIASAYIIAGLISTLMTLYYKIPLLAMPTLSGMLVMGPVLAQFSVPEIVMGLIIAGVVLVLLGFSGVIDTVSRYMPIPIVMGMIAGVYMSYGTGIVTSVKAIPLIGVCTVLAYLVTPLVSKKVPQTASALVVGVVLTLILSPLEFKTGSFSNFLPTFVAPKYSSSVILGLSLPLVLVTIADLLKCYGVIKANGYEVPVNSMIFFPAVGSILGACFLAPTLSMTGAVTAILCDSSAGPKDFRYVGAVLKNLCSVAIGISAGVLVPFLLKLPTNITSILAGLAMMGLFLTSLNGAFGGKKFQIGAFTAFILALSNFTLWGVSSAVWSIVIGIIVSMFLERGHFKNESQVVIARAAVDTK